MTAAVLEGETGVEDTLGPTEVVVVVTAVVVGQEAQGHECEGQGPAGRE